MALEVPVYGAAHPGESGAMPGLDSVSGGEAAAKRREEGIRVVGRKAVIRMSIFKRVPPPTPPWWQERRRQITAWARMSDALTQEYLTLYWRFQEAFRCASDCLKAL